MIARHGAGQAVGQLASPWPISPRFLLNNRPIPKHRNRTWPSLNTNERTGDFSNRFIFTGRISPGASVDVQVDQDHLRPIRPIEEERGLAPSAVPVPVLPTRNSAASNRSSIRSQGSMTINRRGIPSPCAVPLPGNWLIFPATK